MKNIKLVALDLDGTLFNKESIISKRNLDTRKWHPLRDHRERQRDL